MKYFVVLISIVLIFAAVWVVFFSGIILHKKVNNSGSTASGQPIVVALETNFGTIKVELNSEAAPKTAANFAKLVAQGFYDGLTFHRAIDRFMIQGGDPKGDGTGGPGYTVPAEIGLPHKAGAIATARIGDQANPERASSGSQFFIVLSDAPAATLQALDAGGYTVFGQVVAGMDVVDAIGKVKTGANDKPLEPAIIKRAILINE